jgi:outer membrane protein assembly factor BamB
MTAKKLECLAEVGSKTRRRPTYMQMVVGFALTVVVMTVQAAHGQTVTVAPVSGHPGATVTLTGAGFGDREAADVYVDTTDLVLTVSSATGTLTTSVTIPASEQPGVHFLTAIGRRTGDAAQVAFTVTTPWVEPGFGAKHLSWNPYENTISTANVATLGELWSAPTATYGSTPAVISGRVYVTTSSGIQALSTTTGAVVWNKLPGVVFYGSPAVAGGLVYAMSETGSTFYALTTSTGATKWTQTLGSGSFSSPIVVNGVVYVGCNDGKIYALNATTGAILWSFATGSSIEGMPVVVDGVVYAGSTNNSIYALNATTGALIWSYATGGAVEGSPSLANGVLYQGSDDASVYALRTAEPAPGTLLWKITTGSDVYQTPAVAESVVYIGSQDGNLYALNAHSGATLWTFTVGSILGNAVVANNVVYATGRDGSLYALDAANGSLLATANVGYSFLGSPVVSDGILYLNAFDGNTYAFGLLAGVNSRKQSAVAPLISSLHPDLSLQAR